jgi:hypothetical protein
LKRVAIALLLTASISNAQTTDRPKPLTDRGLANLIAFTRLFGYVRYFHPSEAAAFANWEAIAIDGVRSVESAKNAAELTKRLEAIFLPLGPTIEIHPTGKRARKAEPQIPAGASLLAWRHQGIDQDPKMRLGYESKRETRAATDTPPPYEADLGGGVSARVPLAVVAPANGAMPVVAEKPPPAETPKPTANDRATRLADVVLVWNAIQHFYPYFDVVKTDWHEVLRSTLKRAATDAGEREFLHTLRTMLAAIQDGHAMASHPSERLTFTAPLLFDWIEEKVVVTHVADPSVDAKRGDVVERVDGKPVAEWLREAESMISAATPRRRRVVAMTRLRSGTEGSELRLDLRSAGGDARPVVLKRVSMADLAEPRPPKVHEIEPKIFYFDLTRMENADWTTALPRLADARAVIFDLRGRPPRIELAFLQHLHSEPMRSPRWLIPIVRRPDRVDLSEWDTSRHWDVQPKEPRIHAKVVFLADATVISYAEGIMSLVEAYRLGEIVGEPTAGTNGNINPVTLPGGYRVFWTGMRTLKHDGSRHHGVGILPTVPVSRTIRGIAEGRDEQLERALALVR